MVFWRLNARRRPPPTTTLCSALLCKWPWNRSTAAGSAYLPKL